MKRKTTKLKFFHRPSRFMVVLLLTGIGLLSYIESSAQYTSKNAPIGGGGFVTGIVTHPTSGDRYCRTDVGGAYRWDAANNKWVQLLDWLSESQSDFYGVEALALDPQNANNVYMLCGTNYTGNGKSAILKSTDKGNTFTYTDLTATFKVHGNGSGRGNGERLVVDPHNSNILFCGTRANGLWKSTDAGVTWNQVWTGVTTTTNGNGICFVVFDPSSSVVGGATQNIYIGVSRTGSANVYKSTNGGTTFTNISPTTTYMPHRVALQGTTMYVTFSDTEGPATNGYGQVWKQNTSTGTWTDVTPSSNKNHSYGGISIDPTNVNRVVVSTCGVYQNQQFKPNNWGEFFFLSTNGGSSWTLKNGTNATYDANGMAWTNGGAVNWMDCIEFDQSNTNIVRVIGGGGIYTCPNITVTNPSWKYDVIGIEETAWLDAICIPGGPLISSFGDVTGFVHSPLTSYPSSRLTPSDGNNQSIAYAGANTSKVVRASNGGNVVYYSSDTGATWTGCATNKGTDGKVSISADGATILHCPRSSSTTWYSTNNGGTWSSCSGVSMTDAMPVADQVNANYFYVYEPSTGKMYRSTNKGVSFSVAGTPGNSTANYPWEPATIRTVPGYTGHIWVPRGGNGMKYSTDFGATYTNVANVTYCKAIGIGKAKVGATYPTIFIWGTVSGVTGLFQSTNQGASWTRMNDDAHEFGGASLLIGDMDVFGRVYMASNGGRGVVYWEQTVVTGTTVSGSVSPSTIVNNKSNDIVFSVTATDDGSVSSVKIDLSSIGGGSAVSMNAAGGNDYTLSYTVPAGTATGGKSITVSVTDNIGNVTTETITLTVNPYLTYLDIYTDASSMINGTWGSTITEESNAGAIEGIKDYNVSYTISGWWAGVGLNISNWSSAEAKDFSGYDSLQISYLGTVGTGTASISLATASGGTASVSLPSVSSYTTLSIPLTSFTGGDLSKVTELDISFGGIDAGSGTLRIDNMKLVAVAKTLVTSIQKRDVVDVSLYPNPAKEGRFSVQLPEISKNSVVRIYDNLGKLLFENVINDNDRLEVNSGLNKGIYIVNVISKGESFTKKLIVK